MCPETQLDWSVLCIHGIIMSEGMDKFEAGMQGRTTSHVYEAIMLFCGESHKGNMLNILLTSHVYCARACCVPLSSCNPALPLASSWPYSPILSRMLAKRTTWCGASTSFLSDARALLACTLRTESLYSCDPPKINPSSALVVRSL